MKVSPYDLPFRWLVESDTREDVAHLVEFESTTGLFIATCSCEHYQFRIGPDRARGLTAADCKHAVAAREAFHEYALTYAQEQHERTK